MTEQNERNAVAPRRETPQAKADDAARRRAKARRLEEKRRKRRLRRIRRTCLSILAGVLVLAALIGGGMLAYRGLSGLLSSRPFLKQERYPVEYADLISTYSELNGLEPAYVASVILAESSYNPQAVSAANARGLMQLMEETAGDIAGWLGEDFDWDAMFDPETNIRYGCYYLGRLMRRYDNDMRTASTAYHQGPGMVDRWLTDPNNSADGRTLAVIASDATRVYVERILRYYEKYAEIYAQPEG